MFNTQVSSIPFFLKTLHTSLIRCCRFPRASFCNEFTIFSAWFTFPVNSFFLACYKSRNKNDHKTNPQSEKQTNKQTKNRSQVRSLVLSSHSYLFFFNLTFEILLVFRRVHMTNEMKKLITKNSCKIQNKNTPSQQMTLATTQMQ